MSSSEKWTKDNISFPEYVENTLDKDKQGGLPLVGPGSKLEFDKFAAPFKLSEELQKEIAEELQKEIAEELRKETLSQEGIDPLAVNSAEWEVAGMYWYPGNKKQNQDKHLDLSIEHFTDILDDVISQVSSGKGEARHGHGKPLAEQPWKAITDNVGTGFVLGQAMKKLMELRSFKDIDAWKREALGAIVYIVFAIMFVEKEGKV